jgi:hypothetical protein
MAVIMSKKDKKRQREAAIKAEIARREKDRRDRSPLTRDEMLKLLDYVGEKVMIEGHNHDFSYTCEWLQSNGFEMQQALKFFSDENIQDDCPVHPTLMALLARGGGCDCEVLLNVEPETIYP